MKKQEYRPYEENTKEFQDKLFESRIEAVNLAHKKAPKREWAKYTERMIHIIFLLLGLITVGCVLLITIYLVISGIPAIREIGLVEFLFSKEWASTAAEPKYGILPFILTSVYGTAGAILIGVPIGFMTAVYLSKLASPKVKSAMQSAVSLLAGIPSVVYGLVGMLVLVPAIRKIFNVPDGASLLAAIIVLAIMILPSVISVSESSLRAVPESYYEGGLALGASHERSVFFAVMPAAKSGILAGVILGIGRAIGETMAVMMVMGNAIGVPKLLGKGETISALIAMEMGIAEVGSTHYSALYTAGLVLMVLLFAINIIFEGLKKKLAKEGRA